MRGGLIVTALLAAGQAEAQAVSQAPDAVAITIYRRSGSGDARDPDAEADLSQGLAQITETRTIDLPAGRSQVSFRGVAETIVPQTVAVEGLPGAVLERNQDYDLLSPGALVRASVGRTVRLVRTDRRTGSVTDQPAVIRASGEGVVLETANGAEALSCSGLPERLVFDQIPPSLRDTPTLSVLADLPRPGRATVRLSYLATGFTWSADYVAQIRPDGRSLDLIGWLTLSNQTATSFGQAPTQVVAGELSRDDATAPTIAEAVPLRLGCWPRTVAQPRLQYSAAKAMPASAMADSRIEEVMVTARKRAELSELGDYKLYTLPEPTTVAARQTKQVLFLEQKAVRYERVYVYRLYGEDGDFDEDDVDETPAIVLRVQNTAAAGLGKPLPSGVFSVMQPTRDGRPILGGEHRARDTPVGQTLDMELGRAMDITVAPRVLEQDEDKNGGRYTVAVDLTNAKTEPVTLEYRHVPYGRDFKVSNETQRHTAKAGDVMWTIRLAAGEQRTLRYSVVYKDE